MTQARGQAVSDPRLRVEVHVGRVGERAEAWRQLWRRLLAPPPCKDDRLPLHFEQKDGGKGDA